MTANQLCGVLLQYASASHRQLFPNIVADFQAVANRISQEELRRGLAASLHVEPADVIAELFRHSDVHQRAAVLQILASYLDGGSLEFVENTGVLGFPPNSRT